MMASPYTRGDGEMIPLAVEGVKIASPLSASGDVV